MDYGTRRGTCQIRVQTAHLSVQVLSVASLAAGLHLPQKENSAHPASVGSAPSNHPPFKAEGRALSRPPWTNRDLAGKRVSPIISAGTRPTNRRQAQEGGLKGSRAQAQLGTGLRFCGGVGELGAATLVLALRSPAEPLPPSPALAMFLTRSEYDRSVRRGDMGSGLWVGRPGAGPRPGFCRVTGRPGNLSVARPGDALPSPAASCDSPS